MSTHDLLIVSAAFLASAVEAVEALTIVLAVGLTSSWRTALAGMTVALVALAGLVLVLGPALAEIIPLNGLQVLIGALLMVFGLQWLRKAILRGAGHRAKHDEAAVFAGKVADLTRDPGGVLARDWNGFVVAFKGVFLEGLEVIFIVLAIGANRGDGALGLSAIGALLALAVVIVVGAVAHRPLTRVPENAIKFTVGVLLVAFGTFWAGEGLSLEWHLHEWTIPLLAVLYGAVGFGLIAYLKREPDFPGGRSAVT